MGKSKRQTKVRRVQPEWHPGPAEPSGPQQQVSQLSPPQLLEQIERARLARDAAEAELAVLTDRAVNLGIGWPEIATRLGVTRLPASTTSAATVRTPTVQIGRGAGKAGDDGPATSAGLNDPTGAAVTADGGLLIADLANNEVRAVSTD